ncbi:LacI family DNA-binding transcriptional regulator [Glycomyces sp. TRM65418]|uniref:LacI family DNA-binding transcriptional regulator n=1 Tax=Glycomyces sp. TRM65418 TaxID=2867006 RepID=UPI001CE556AB|nr:LacI family DNA-binding transcriptional regulator [Glycomyces sp. TRM65418]MCC3765131.1 LacI family DNA-binding transcriptional regulator [Glycomyces sp. TRM65418]QZD54759.1 LacI family DNA-binding transcriptional regulator [Glycomyces sp. TRM65418]
MSAASSPEDAAPATGDTLRRPPGMTDVARLAGVSQKTVSRVVNNERYVSEAAREKVLRAAAELGFRPNTAARALITGRFRRIGVVSLGSALYGPASLLVALERATRAAGLSFMVANTAEGEPGAIQEAVDWLLAQGVDGIILSEPIDEGQRLRLDSGVPIVSLGQAPGLPAEQIALAHGRTAESCREAVAHLLDLGHARVWHVAGPQEWWEGRERREGWAAAHRERGIEPPPPFEGDWSPAAGYAAGRELPGEATAVFCANDDTAIGLIRALTETGRRVPDDVSVVGFDDIPAAAYLSPPLTTIRQDFEADAIHGLNLLLRLLPGAAEPEGDDTTAAPRRLVVRASTAPPPPS